MSLGIFGKKKGARARRPQALFVPVIHVTLIGLESQESESSPSYHRRYRVDKSWVLGSSSKLVCKLIDSFGRKLMNGFANFFPYKEGLLLSVRKQDCWDIHNNLLGTLVPLPWVGVGYRFI